MKVFENSLYTWLLANGFHAILGFVVLWESAETPVVALLVFVYSILLSSPGLIFYYLLNLLLLRLRGPFVWKFVLLYAAGATAVIFNLLILSWVLGADEFEVNDLRVGDLSFIAALFSITLRYKYFMRLTTSNKKI